ncbi:transcription factor e(y)2-domain-containing protein [Ephemerocybe angulata]|uniref:Transcription and mRNA export factor SUS1 n=1 Tax=Ephemerocybe angulata TaxID=980116 RepID=A0A8H6M4A5_9AGAR|nr:transcription factor e(y)2-domain-containing protein [Tulosesus angulatus]
MPQQDPQALYAQIRRRFIETGEWDQIRGVLQARLNESGWLDEIKNRGKERARDMDPLSFQALFDELRPNAQNSIPLVVKKEINAVIRQHLDRHLQ